MNNSTGVYLNKSKLVFYLVSVVGLLIALTATLYLPARFFGDTNVIVYDRWHEIGLKGSYPFTIWFYHVTGLKNLPFFVVGGMQYLIVIYILYKIGVSYRFHKVTIKNGLILVMFLVTAIYLSMPAKDFINLVYVSVVVFLFKTHKYKITKTVIIGMLLLLFFSYFFRSYYLLVVLLSIVMYCGSHIKIKNKRLAIVTSSLLILVCMSLSYGFLKGNYVTKQARYNINQTRHESTDANSIIVSPIPPTSWYGEVFSIFYGFVSVNIPVNGLKHMLKPQIVAFVIWQLLFFFIVLKRFSFILKKGIKNNYELWLFFMLFSFFIVQGIFEPDLGSSIRHKVSVFPLIYYLFYYEEFRKELR